MNLHEYQASQLLAKFHLPIVPGGSASSIQEANNVVSILQHLNPLGYVIKAQVHSGGRGRGVFKKSQLQGGVQIVESGKQIIDYAGQMLGDQLVTKQSGPEGKPCNTVYIVEKVKLKRELYLSIMIDRENACPLVICSPKGGMGIEEVDPQFIL